MAQPPFSGTAVHSYADGPPRQVPGFFGLHRMTTLLLAERVPADGRVRVLGAGGGLKLKAFAEAHAGWSFDGVDPSADMLRLAGEAVVPFADRVRLHQGYIESAPDGPFDAATSILVFHFIPREQRLETLRQIRHRLKPGAPFALAHIGFPQTEPAPTAGMNAMKNVKLEAKYWTPSRTALAFHSGRRSSAMAAVSSALPARM